MCACSPFLSFFSHTVYSDYQKTSGPNTLHCHPTPPISSQSCLDSGLDLSLFYIPPAGLRAIPMHARTHITLVTCIFCPGPDLHAHINVQFPQSYTPNSNTHKHADTEWCINKICLVWLQYIRKWHWNETGYGDLHMCLVYSHIQRCIRWHKLLFLHLVMNWIQTPQSFSISKH